MSKRFQTTHWSLVLAAAEKDTPRGREALATLCEAYWYPLYAYIRCQGHDVDEARDLTQAYFVRLLEKNYLGDVKPEAGRFRSFLLASLKHFLANEREKALALKRAGGGVPICLDMETAEVRYGIEPTDELTPESVFERRWAMTILERTLDRLSEEFSFAGKSQQFDRLKLYLTGDEPRAPYKRTAEELGISEGALKVAVHRLRRRFGKVLRAQIAETVSGHDQIEAEIRHLLSGC